MNHLPSCLDDRLDQADTQPDLATQLQRALRRSISDQEFASPMTSSIPDGSDSAYARSMSGVQHRDLGALESGRSGKYSVNVKMSSVKEDPRVGGAKVVPMEGGGAGGKG